LLGLVFQVLASNSETLLSFLELQEVICASFKMKVDLSRIQQASALSSDESEDSDRELSPEWDSRTEPFDDYYTRAQAYINRPNQDAPRSPSLPSPFLRPHERSTTDNRGSLSEALGGCMRLFTVFPVCDPPFFFVLLKCHRTLGLSEMKLRRSRCRNRPAGRDWR
jgi:hypothetical protein